MSLRAAAREQSYRVVAAVAGSHPGSFRNYVSELDSSRRICLTNLTANFTRVYTVEITILPTSCHNNHLLNIPCCMFHMMQYLLN